MHTEWAFDSDTPEDFRTILPMLGIDYRMALSATGTAPDGPYDFDVGFAMPNGVETLPLSAHPSRSPGTGRDLEASRDGSAAKTSCAVRVSNKAGAKASLRVGHRRRRPDRVADDHRRLLGEVVPHTRNGPGGNRLVGTVVATNSRGRVGVGQAWGH